MNIEKVKDILVKTAEEIKLQHFIWVNTGEIAIKVHANSLPLGSALKAFFSDTHKRSVKKLSFKHGYSFHVLSVDMEDSLVITPSAAVVGTTHSQVFNGEVLFFKGYKHGMCIGFTYAEIRNALNKVAVFSAATPVSYDVSSDAEKALLSHPSAAQAVSWMNFMSDTN